MFAIIFHILFLFSYYIYLSNIYVNLRSTYVARIREKGVFKRDTELNHKNFYSPLSNSVLFLFLQALALQVTETKQTEN